MGFLISVFDLDKLRDLLQDFYAITRIRITVFDENLKELVSYPQGIAPYCRVIRRSMSGLEACLACDRAACRTASKKHGTYIYRCHAGLTEAVTPLYAGDILVGYLLFGHVFSYPSREEGLQAIERLTASLPIDMGRLIETLEQAVPIEESYIRSAAHILHAVASYSIIEHMAELKEDALAVRLDAYLNAHFTENMNAARIAEHLGIGKTRLYELSRQLYDCGTAEHIRTLRIQKAKDLLNNDPELPLKEIAEACGYPDYNYFITVFTHETGRPPRAWRRSNEPEKGA